MYKILLEKNKLRPMRGQTKTEIRTVVHKAVEIGRTKSVYSYRRWEKHNHNWRKDSKNSPVIAIGLRTNMKRWKNKQNISIPKLLVTRGKKQILIRQQKNQKKLAGKKGS